MGHIRIETVSDSDSGMFIAEAFFEDTLIARSDPQFTSPGEAEAEVVEIIRRAWPDRNPFAVDPSIGV